MSHPDEVQLLSDDDDEIYFGKLSLKEIKKHSMMGLDHGQSWSSKTYHGLNHEADCNTSVHIIETHSQPNLQFGNIVKTPIFASVPGSPVQDNRKSDESFMLMEKMVSNFCLMPEKEKDMELNNTSEAIEYILNNGPNQNSFKAMSNNVDETEKLILQNPVPSEANKHDSTPKKIAENISVDCNTSVHINETHSQSNLQLNNIVKTPIFASVTESPVQDNRKSDESFILMEKMVSKLCLTPEKGKDLKLNNTLEAIEYILKNGPNQNSFKTLTKNEDEIEKLCLQNPVPSEANKHDSTPKKKGENISVVDSPKYLTPLKSAQKLQTDTFATPSSIVSKTPTFKTPAYPLSQKKPPASLRSTPYKTKAFQHITSPVACYIRNSPQVPLVKDVHPRKPLPGTSSIPKLLKNPTQSKMQNKENTNLPSVAYKSAKKTKVINVSPQKLPQSQWAKNIAFPQPTIMKHENRESSAKKPLVNQQEDSFANLSSLQADISICTQKAAYN